ncbi:response regulator transcription factor [Saprospiraceae bacterium]|nr:response regulator transcription factor [Saprospiraceae bacterium]
MNKINCLVVDDEELARDLVQNYINRLSHLNLVAKCADPLEAMQVMQEQKVDLIFLDIQMPNLTGIEFLKTLPHKPLIIFTTAYKEYALESYELDVVDYLLKPFRFERFLQAINKVSLLLKPDNTPPAPVASEVPPPANTEVEKDYVLVKSDFKVYRIFHDDILYIESMKEYVAYHTKDQRTLSLGSLKKLEQDLPTAKFMRIHKSYIANISRIAALEGNMVHIGDKKIPIGSSYKEAVMKKVF